MLQSQVRRGKFPTQLGQRAEKVQVSTVQDADTVGNFEGLAAQQFTNLGQDGFNAIDAAGGALQLSVAQAAAATAADLIVSGLVRSFDRRRL